MNIAVLGSGSIGMLVTCYLAKAGADPLLITRKEKDAEIVERQGITLKYLHSEEKETLSIRAGTISNLLEAGPIDIAIIAVKSYQVKEMLDQVKNFNIRTMLFLQNGMEHTEYFSCLKDRDIASAVVEHGALKENTHTVIHTGIGQIKWSYVHHRCNQVDEMTAHLKHPCFKMQQEANWYDMLISKLVVNACINPLTAIFRVANGELLSKQYISLLETVFNEVTMILNCSYDKKRDFWKTVQTVCKNTAKNHSSMLVDIEQKRQTEIDSILGYLLKVSGQKGKDSKIIKFLFDGIKALESTERGV